MDQLLSQAWNLILNFNSLPLPGKISGIVLLVLALWKSSFVQPYWAKLGAWQVVVAPTLGVVIAVVSVQPLTLAAIWQSLLGGLISIALHELLDAAKSIPTLGPIYVRLICAVESFLGSPKAQARKPLPSPGTV